MRKRAHNLQTYQKGYEMSTSQVARSLGLTKRTVERTEKSALQKIAREFKRRGIDATDAR